MGIEGGSDAPIPIRPTENAGAAGWAGGPEGGERRGRRDALPGAAQYAIQRHGPQAYGHVYIVKTSIYVHMASYS